MSKKAWIFIVLVCFVLGFLIFELPANKEIERRIQQCREDPQLDAPVDFRSVYDPSLYAGYGGTNLVVPCSIYRNLSR